MRFNTEADPGVQTIVVDKTDRNHSKNVVSSRSSLSNNFANGGTRRGNNRKLMQAKVETEKNAILVQSRIKLLGNEESKI